MSVLIKCNTKPILYIRNAIFETIYTNIVDNIENGKLSISSNLESLIEQLSLGCQGLGTDLAKYLKDYDDTLLFAQLVEHAIKKCERDYPDLLYSTQKSLWNFQKEIEEYAKILKNKEVQQS